MAVIAVSRGSMGLGQRLAENLASALGCPCIDREAVVQAAHRLGVSQDVMDKKMERVPTFWERLTSDRKVYVMAMQSALMDQVAKGDCVYHSWAGHMLLLEIPVLRVRVVAPLEVRIPLAMERERISRERAIEYIRKVDEDRARWTRFIYGIDWADPALYDVALNLGVTSLETACAVVKAMAERPEFSLEPVRERLPDFVLAARVRVALASHPSTRALDLEVKAEKGTVTVAGTAEQASISDAIERAFENELRAVVLGVDGVTDVNLVIRPGYTGIID